MRALTLAEKCGFPHHGTFNGSKPSGIEIGQVILITAIAVAVGIGIGYSISNNRNRHLAFLMKNATIKRLGDPSLIIKAA
jgi:hypothetical protein